MDEEEWRNCADPMPMLEFLRDKASDRKLRMFTFGCCRAAQVHFTERVHQEALQVAERHADGEATDAELGRVVAQVHRHRRKGHAVDRAVYSAVRYPRGGPYTDAGSVAADVARVAATAAAPNPSATELLHFRVGEPMVRERPEPNADRLTWNATFADQQRINADLLRDIFGNPFRSVALDPAWLTSDVLALARGIYDERAFDRMPILADALQDAGCANDDVLNHCRGAGPHVRGCWVVDLVLGKV